jgi:hypothetical protein
MSRREQFTGQQILRAIRAVLECCKSGSESIPAGQRRNLGLSLNDYPLFPAQKIMDV